MIPCPNCGETHDITHYQVGDRLWCVCGQWLMVAQRHSGVRYVVKVNALGPRPHRKKRS